MPSSWLIQYDHRAAMPLDPLAQISGDVNLTNDIK